MKNPLVGGTYDAFCIATIVNSGIFSAEAILVHLNMISFTCQTLKPSHQKVLVYFMNKCYLLLGHPAGSHAVGSYMLIVGQ